MKPLHGLDVIVLAGGLGTRLREVLVDRPKVLAPLGDRADGRVFLDHLLDHLAEQGARRVVLSLGHLADQVVAHLDRVPPPLPVEWVIETTPQGTAGGVCLALPKAGSNPVMVMNGDTWIEPDYTAFLTNHAKTGAPISILCARMDDVSRYGTVEADGDGMLAAFAEKVPGRQGPGLVSAGILLLNESAQTALTRAVGPSLERDFLSLQPPHSIAVFVDDGRFLDIGTPESLAQAPAWIGGGAKP